MMARLARWLGPWTAETRRPRGIRRRTVRIPARVQGPTPLEAWVYRRDAPPQGALLVVPGLHYLGPADPRLDRFLAILADAGLLVMCPFLPEFRRLTVGPSLVEDTVAAFTALRALPDLPPGIRPGAASISFGSYPAIHLATDEDGPGALVLFGGYASFEDVIRFSLEGNPDRPHDPLNRPVVFLNLLPHLPEPPDDPDELRDALVTYTRRTWGKPENKERARWEPVARELASRMRDPKARSLFLVATGAEPGGAELATAALELGHEALSHLDPQGALSRVRCPVAIVHGRDDDVIPHTHAQMLFDALKDRVPTRLLLTGMYAHTGHGVVDPRALSAELEAMVGILGAFVDAGTHPARDA